MLCVTTGKTLLRLPALGQALCSALTRRQDKGQRSFSFELLILSCRMGKLERFCYSFLKGSVTFYHCVGSSFCFVLAPQELFYW